MIWNRFLMCIMLCCTIPALAQTPGLEVAVKRVKIADMVVFDVTATGAVKASPEAVWKVLTNYEGMPGFVPDLHTSRVLSRTGDEAIVEQFGVARFLFMRRDIHLIVLVREQAPTRIDISLVTGDMKYYKCRWELIPMPETGGTRIVYSGELAPKFYVPGMIGANIVRADVERMMQAVLARLDQEP